MARKWGSPGTHHYKDTGCELAPRCTECPFPLCKHDIPNWHSKDGMELERMRDSSGQFREVKLGMPSLLAPGR